MSESATVTGSYTFHGRCGIHIAGDSAVDQDRRTVFGDVIATHQTKEAALSAASLYLYRLCTTVRTNNHVLDPLPTNTGVSIEDTVKYVERNGGLQRWTRMQNPPLVRVYEFLVGRLGLTLSQVYSTVTECVEILTSPVDSILTSEEEDNYYIVLLEFYTTMCFRVYDAEQLRTLAIFVDWVFDYRNERHNTIYPSLPVLLQYSVYVSQEPGTATKSAAPRPVIVRT